MRYSEKESYNGCPLRYKLTHDGLKKAKDGKESCALKFGQAVHAGLEAHYKGLAWDAIEGAFKKEYAVALDDSDLARTPENGLELLRRYIAFYKTQDDVWEVIDTEHEGTIDVADEDHGLHIDLIAKHRQTGEIYFWDHKTTAKSPSPTYWKTYELSGQVSRYTDYIIQKYGSCGGCYINNIALGFRKKKWMGEPAGLWIKFERQLFNRTPQQLAYWRESDEAWMKQIEFSKANNVWGKALNGLCAWCEFYDLCLASGDEQIKELLYKNNETMNVEVA